MYKDGLFLLLPPWKIWTKMSGSPTMTLKTETSARKDREASL